jgi:cell wall-associated NlpC family hydrolase
MKKVILLSFVLANTLLAVYSQTDKFNAAMGSTLQQLQAAKTPDEMGAVAAKFERIGDAEKTQWLPYYYAAMVKARMAFGATDKDQTADAASVILNKADSLAKNNSEIYCVKAMICYAHLMVDPMTRWKKYGADASANLEAAKKADATNPRPVILQANSLKNTPENFGGGCKSAKPLALQAAKMLADFKPNSPLHPNWGKEIIDQILTSCN